MPGFVRTPEDEEKWQKAKKIVQEQHGEISWPLVTHVFTQMKKGEDIKSPLLDPEYRKKLADIDVKIKRQKLGQMGVPTLPTKEEKEEIKKDEDDYDDYDGNFSRIKPYTKDDFRRDITSNDAIKRIRAIKSEHMTPEFVIHTLRNDPSSTARHAAWESPKFSHEKHWQHIREEDKPFVKRPQLKAISGEAVSSKPSIARGKLSVVKSKELDDLGSALKILKKSIEILKKAKKEEVSSFSPDELTVMEPWLNKGFNHDEAAHMSGTRVKPYSLKSTRKSTEMSPEMLSHAKAYAQKHMQKLKEYKGETSDPKHSPVIHESHHSSNVTKNIAKDLSQFLNEYKMSGALDGLPPHKKAAAINLRAAEWRANNIDQEKQKAADVAKQLGDLHSQSSTARSSELMQQRMHLLTGGGASTSTADDLDELPQDLEYSKEDEEAL